MKKKICIVTGSRAEYGLQKNLINLINRDKTIKLFLIVSGMHLSKEHGNTIKQIQKDKIRIHKKIKIVKKKSDVLNEMSLLIKEISKELKKIKPDIVLLVGDRYEIFATAIAAYYLKIKIAHFHGGETTIGSLDEGARHSISKLSNLHFVANQSFKEKLIRMGEDPINIFAYGGLGVDNILSTKFLNKKKIENFLGTKLAKYNFLVTYHPEKENIKKQIKFIKSSIGFFLKMKNTKVLITAPNSDTNNADLIKVLKNEVNKNRKILYYYPSLGNQLYYSLIKFIDCVIGNSSSGICEVPSLKKGTINVGDRQDGRPRSKSVIDIKYEFSQFKAALKKIMSTKFKQNLNKNINPYGNNKSSKLIFKKIKQFLKDNKKNK
ncbi:UDP-N-acetylglucosamine 2-epimerase [Candidatus Pelagibacter sp.]|nr:UDP-N-acetylglucosamine 2-epimerase [Candidatus Pelagibacter sp.]